MRNRRQTKRAHRHAAHPSRPPPRRPDDRRGRRPTNRPTNRPPIQHETPDEQFDAYVRTNAGWQTDADWRALYDGPYIALEADGRPVRSLRAVRAARDRATDESRWRNCYGLQYDIELVPRRCACGRLVERRYVGGEVLALSGCGYHAHDGRGGGECPTPGTRDDCDRCYWRCWECGDPVYSGLSGIVCSDCVERRLVARSLGAVSPSTFASRMPWLRVELEAGADYGWPLARVLWLAMAAGALPAARAVARRYPRLFDALARWAASRYDRASVRRGYFITPPRHR